MMRIGLIIAFDYLQISGFWGLKEINQKERKTYYFNPFLSLLLIKIIHDSYHSLKPFPQFYYRVFFFSLAKVPRK